MIMFSNSFPQIKPLMKASFQTVIYTGSFGSATLPKVMSNMLTVVHIIALGEVLMIGNEPNTRQCDRLILKEIF